MAEKRLEDSSAHSQLSFKLNYTWHMSVWIETWQDGRGLDFATQPEKKAAKLLVEGEGGREGVDELTSNCKNKLVSNI